MPGLTIIPVRNLDDRRLEIYRNQRDAWLRAAHNPARPSISPAAAAPSLFMAEGLLVVRTLLASAHSAHSILATPDRFELIRAEALAHAQARGVDLPVFLADPPILEQIVGFDLHRGLLAAGLRPSPPDPAHLIRTSRLLVLAEDLSNHDNVGGLFRTVAAMVGPGAGVLLSPRCCDPLYRKALRVSMGHALTVPFDTLDPWPDALCGVAAAGFRLVPLITPEARTSANLAPISPPDQSDLPARIALLVGAEGPGLDPRTLALLADPALRPAAQALSIPMASGVDSLNVVVALAIALDRLSGGRGPGAPDFR